MRLPHNPLNAVNLCSPPPTPASWIQFVSCLSILDTICLMHLHLGYNLFDAFASWIQFVYFLSI